MKKILVIGGCGYIGGLTTDFLLESGYDVTVFDNLLYESRFLKQCPFIYGDIRDTAKLSAVHSKYDEIIWLAAIVGDGACAQNPELTQAVNVDSIKNFLNQTKRRIIFTSTCSVYGAQDGILNESSPTKPLSVYASTKLQAEEYVLKHQGLVFRLGTLFGLGDCYSRIRLDLVVNLLTLKAFRDKKLTVFGGDQWRPLLAVRDVAHYLVESVNTPFSDIYNIKLQNVRLVDLAMQLKEIFPEVEIETSEIKFEDLRNYQADSSKAEHDFIFKPTTTVIEEALRIRQLFEENRIKNVDDNIYYNTNYVKALLDNHEL